MPPTPQFTAELIFHFQGYSRERRNEFVFNEEMHLHRRVPMKMNGVEGLNTLGMWIGAPVVLRESDTATVRCIVLAPELFTQAVKPGVTFELWDGGFFASGKILERIEEGWPASL